MSERTGARWTFAATLGLALACGSSSGSPPDAGPDASAVGVSCRAQGGECVPAGRCLHRNQPPQDDCEPPGFAGASCCIVTTCAGSGGQCLSSCPQLWVAATDCALGGCCVPSL